MWPTMRKNRTSSSDKHWLSSTMLVPVDPRRSHGPQEFKDVDP
jgi:hypothetical protein